MNFNHLGLKKLICTCYAGSPISHTEFGDLPLFCEGRPQCEKLPYMIEITEVKDLNKDGAEDMDDIELLLRNDKNTLTLLDGDGDFRSEECIGFLEEADIVVTNPPFSLFREYTAQLVKYNKKFLIIGNKNAMTYKEFFPLLKENRVWIGYTVPSLFKIPDGELIKQVNGLCRWFTNLDTKKRHEKLILYKKYTPEEYPKYDNYDAINVDKVSEIPIDYYENMGVPITFLGNYNPEQFEIIGLLQSSTDEQAGTPNLRYYNDFKEMRQDMTYTGASGGKANGNPVLSGKSKKGNFLHNEKTGEYVHSIYARILIKRRTNEN